MCDVFRITFNGKSETDIKSRTDRAKQSFYKKKNLFTVNSKNFKNHVNSYKEFCMEHCSWTIIKAEKKKIVVGM